MSSGQLEVFGPEQVFADIRGDDIHTMKRCCSAGRSHHAAREAIDTAHEADRQARGADDVQTTIDQAGDAGHDLRQLILDHHGNASQNTLERFVPSDAFQNRAAVTLERLGAFAGRDVAPRRDAIADLSAFIAHRFDADIRPDGPAVLVVLDEFGSDRFAGAQHDFGTFEQPEAFWVRDWTVNDPRVLPDHLLAAVTQVIGECLIDVDHARLELAVNPLQFAHEYRVVGLHNRRLEQFHAVLAAFVFGNVKLYAAQHGGLARIVNHRDHITNPNFTPIFGDHAILGLVIDPRFDGQSEICQRRLEVVRVNVVLPEGRIGGPIFRFVPEDAPHLRTDEGHAGFIGVCLPDDAVNGIDQYSLFALCTFECGMTALLIGDIQERAAQTDDRAKFVLDQAGMNLEPTGV